MVHRQLLHQCGRAVRHVHRHAHDIGVRLGQGGCAGLAGQLSQHLAARLFESRSDGAEQAAIVVNQKDGVCHGLSRM
jgi:hypothetical protein